MRDADREWALAGSLLAIHQAEEVAVSIEGWRRRVGTTTISWLDAHLEGNWLASVDPRRRVAAQAGQTAALGVLFVATRGSERASRITTTGLAAAWGAAMVMHLTVSARTRSLMPGTVTSIVPGIPGVIGVITTIWMPTAPQGRR